MIRNLPILTLKNYFDKLYEPIGGGGGSGSTFEPIGIGGNYYGHALLPRSNFANFQPSIAVLYAIPVFLPAMTIQSVGVYVNTIEAAKSARLGIYKGTSGSLPLVFDAGTTSLGTGGERSLTVNQAVTAGWYWLVVNTTATGTCQLAAATDAAGTGFPAPNFLGSGTATGNPTTHDLQAMAFGVLPSTLTISPTQTGKTPHIFVK